MAFPILGALAPLISTIIGKIFPDPEAKARAEAELKVMDLKVVEQQLASVVAEAKGESMLQRNWRPLTMLTFVAIIANNYILVPYAQAFGLSLPILQLEPQMWELLQIGIGGYMVLRTTEKLLGRR